MSGNDRRRVVIGLGVSAATWLCGASALVVLADSPSPEACQPAAIEKLGVVLHRICPTQAGQAPFWISAPLPCGHGEHGGLACPHATALVQALVAAMVQLTARNEPALVSRTFASTACTRPALIGSSSTLNLVAAVKLFAKAT